MAGRGSPGCVGAASRVLADEVLGRPLGTEIRCCGARRCSCGGGDGPNPPDESCATRSRPVLEAVAGRSVS